MGFGTWDTLDTDLPSTSLSYGTPSTLVDTPRSDGMTWSGLLSGVSATADAITDTFGKVYQIQSNIENTKFQRVVNDANLQLKQVATLGALDVQRATIDANVAIEKARASRAVGDAMAQQASGAAGYVTSGGVSPMLVLGLAGVAALLYFLRGKK